LRARDQAGSTEVFVSFLCLGGERFILLAGKDGDLALAGHFKSNVHDVFLSVVNLSAVADGNDGDRSRIFDEDNAPIANSKPATVGTLEPFYVTGSVGRIDRQFAVDALADIG